MRKTNLLFVITKLELGGAQKQLLSLISNLDRERFNLFLFTAREGFLLPEALSIQGLSVHTSRFLERPVSPIKDIISIFEICRFIKKNGIEAVHTHSSKAGILGRWAARLSGVKSIIHTVHGWSFHDYQSPLFRKFYIWLERLAAKFTDLIIVVSERDKERGLANNIAGAQAYRLVRYGIDKNRLEIKDGFIRQELGLRDDDVVVGSIACLKPQKSPEDFVKLAASINKSFPQVKFLLVGDGKLRSKIEALISQHHLERNIVLTGWRKDIPRLLSAMDIFVLTSLWEGLPISVLEAMASSLPVVATDTGGVREVISEGSNGYMVARRDISQMENRVVGLLKNEELRRRMGARGRISIGDDFSVKAMSEKIRDLYQELFLRKEVPHVH